MCATDDVPYEYEQKNKEEEDMRTHTDEKYEDDNEGGGDKETDSMSCEHASK